MMRAIGIAVLGSMIVCLAGGALLIDAVMFQPMRDRAQQLAVLRDEFLSVRGRRAAVDHELASLRSRPTRTTAMHAFATSDTATTVALIQERLRALTSEVGGILLSSQAGSELAASAGLIRLQVLVRARLSEEGLFRLLAALEAAQPPIVLAAFEVRPGPIDQPPLDFTGVVVAYHANAS